MDSSLGVNRNCICSYFRASIPYVAKGVALTFLVLGILALIDYGLFASFAYSGAVSAVSMSITAFIVLILVAYYSNKCSEKPEVNNQNIDRSQRLNGESKKANTKQDCLEFVRRAFGLNALAPSLEECDYTLHENYDRGDEIVVNKILSYNNKPMLIKCKSGIVLVLPVTEEKTGKRCIFEVYTVGKDVFIEKREDEDDITYVYKLNALDKEDLPPAVCELKKLLENGMNESEKSDPID